MHTRKIRRNTPQRRVIHEELCRLDNHPTAAEIYNAVRVRLPRVSLGTVYRNLDVLYEDGMINRLEFSGNETRYDGTMKPHSHVRCTSCGRLADVFDSAANLPTSAPPELAGFLVTGHRLEYQGVCPGCRPDLAPGGSHPTN
jgi:Fur family ferric uptake transcriptional regulator